MSVLLINIDSAVWNSKTSSTCALSPKICRKIKHFFGGDKKQQGFRKRSVTVHNAMLLYFKTRSF